MDLPETLRVALGAADDAYLQGLSNKGTLNRAKKDLAGLSPTAEAVGETIVVTVGGEKCTITAPLGESKCSCPSSAMCRHRLAAMLWLRDQVGAEPEQKAPEFPSLLAYPTEKLAKQLGARRLAGILFRHRSGGCPKITESSVVTVELTWLPATVRLLEPLEHSTCTCKSKALCLHKAEALLSWQLSKGIAKAEDLEPKITETGLDPERVRGVCGAVCQMLSEQLVTGLSRMPDSVCDTVERMASLSHTAGLPNLERALRNLHGEYAACFARSATFRENALLSRLSHAYRLAAALEAADGEAMRNLAGAFREDYGRSADLKLYLLGLREYTGRSGYAGTIYYFIERENQVFYCYRDLRPTYYERAVRRAPSVSPWGLPCTLKQAWNCAIDLQNPKVNTSGGLSATRECKATHLGHREPWEVVPSEMVAEDFETLLPVSSPRNRELERLVLIRPEGWEQQEYDTVNQRYAMRLLDQAGRDIWLEVRYEQKEAPVIQTLETMAKQLKPSDRPVFFGELYRDGDKLKFYPIEYFLNWEDRP